MRDKQQARRLGREIFFGLVVERSDQFRDMGFVTFQAPHLTWASFSQLKTWFSWVGVDVRLACVSDGERTMPRLVFAMAGQDDPHGLQERLADGYWRMQAGAGRSSH